ncbi:hypothetical protein Bca52824_035325 [Brassica carinata]|uniref:Uncharacterized protein n=1 Tax=Brassica carinata TaxID=52824 RepID=A0A8X7S0F0_BRACI|nr:hypothetical protein Bca52824_035325 [Brassica carinata]
MLALVPLKQSPFFHCITLHLLVISTTTPLISVLILVQNILYFSDCFSFLFDCYVFFLLFSLLFLPKLYVLVLEFLNFFGNLNRRSRQTFKKQHPKNKFVIFTSDSSHVRNYFVPEPSQSVKLYCGKISKDNKVGDVAADKWKSMSNVVCLTIMKGCKSKTETMISNGFTR